MANNNNYSKLSEGLSRVKDSIEQGKQKLALTQEINQLKRELTEVSTKKAQQLLEVGQITYLKIRNQSFQDPQLEELANGIVELDKQAYNISKKIAELTLANDGGKLVCKNCQTENELTDKFCGGCGSNLEEQKPRVVEEVTTCSTCDESIPADANYCPCCGSKLVSAEQSVQ